VAQIRNAREIIADDDALIVDGFRGRDRRQQTRPLARYVEIEGAQAGAP
jgi:hypothetical protein